MMLAIFGLYFIIPIGMIVMIRGPVDKTIKKCRIRYTIPAIILTILNITAVIYLWQTQQLSLLNDPASFFIPGILLLFTIIIYNAGRKKERLLQTEIASQEIENARYKKSVSRAQSIMISTEHEEEIEKL